MKLTRNIRSEEVLPQSYYNQYGAKFGMRAMNPSTFLGAQDLTDYFDWDYITINNWLWGGDRDQSGLRIPGHKYYRNGYGLHDNGNAIDFVPSYGDDIPVGGTVLDVHKMLLKNPELREDLMDLGVYRLEVVWLAVTWIHLDCEYTPGQEDLIFVSKEDRYSVEEYRKELNKRNILDNKTNN